MGNAGGRTLYESPNEFQTGGVSGDVIMSNFR